MNVLLDLSPLDTPSRLRGIGQYVMGLAAGIGELELSTSQGMNVAGVAQLDWRTRSGQPVGLDYKGCVTHPDQFSRFSYILAKRLGLARTAEALRADLLHITEPFAIPARNHVPMVLTCHDLIPLILHKEYLPPFPWSRAQRKRRDTSYYLAARRVIAVSHATRADLIERLSLDESIVDVAQLGIDHLRFNTHVASGEQQRLRQRYSLDRPFVVYVGAFDARKNVASLIRAFGQAGLARDFDLVLAGAMRKQYRTRLESLIAKTATQAAVKMIGYVEEEDLAPLYRACHLHVFPSRYEGFGLPVAEAMACGAPTVAMRASSIPEVAGDAACLVPVDDLDALTEAIRTLCYDDSSRRELSLRGPQAAQRFQWKECARQTLESYKKALG